MIGIRAVGAYIPRYRLSGKLLAQVWGGGGGGERAVANYDEDSLTMGVEAALNALEGLDRSRIDSCALASTTHPFAEKSNSTLLATAVDLPREIRTADFGGSLRVGCSAILAALDAVKAGSARSALVVAADLRSAAPGTELEPLIGDGAAAVVIDSEELLATYEGGYSFSQEFTDVWRYREDRYLQMGDLVFIKAQGYDKFVAEAIEGLLSKLSLKRKDIAKVAFYAPDSRTYQGMTKALKFEDEAYLKTPLLATAGNTGTASPLLGLVAALEEAKPGDRILTVGYGSGAEALCFQATERIERQPWTRGVAAQLKWGRPLTAYGKFLQFRRLVETDVVKAFTSLPTLWREEKGNYRLLGQRCTACGAIQYPRRHVCWKCSGRSFEDYKLARRGKVFTFTKDHLIPNPDPPTIMVSADLEGGGRFYTQLTDCDPKDVDFELPVELTFRLFHEGEEMGNYFWKFRPVL